MAVFSRAHSIIGESGYDPNPVIPDIDLDSLLEDSSVEPCFEDNLLVAGARICAENTVNMNAIIEMAAIEEFNYFEQTGEEMVYEEGKLGGFIEAAKNFFLKLWEKVKSIFKKAGMLFASKAKTDKEFLNKYKKDLNEAQNKGFGDKEIPMFDYVFYGMAESTLTAAFKDKNLVVASDGNGASVKYEEMNNADSAQNAVAILSKQKDIITNITNIPSTTDAAAKETLIKTIDDQIKTVNESDWKTDYYEALRETLLKGVDRNYKGGPVAAKEFSKEIAEVCQKDTSKDDVSLSTAVKKAVEHLENSKSLIKAIDNALKTWKREINSIVKSLEQVQKGFTRDFRKEASDENKQKGYKHTLLSAAIQLMKETKNIMIAFHSGLLTQLKNCSAQSKSICVQAMTYKKPKNESGLLGDSDSSVGGFLGGIEMI